MPEFKLVPLLGIERDLYNMPRDQTRFRRYLEGLKGDTDDVAYPPLVLLNPMGREHVATTLDLLIGLEAERLALEAIEDAKDRLAGFEARLNVGLVVADDPRGGWTNRGFTEMGVRFTPRSSLRRGWVPVVFWSSEEIGRASCRERV